MRDIKELYELLDASTSDKTRMEILFDIATFFLNTNEERTLAVAEEIKALAEKLDSNMGRCYYHSTLGRSLYRKSKFEDASAEFQMALDLSLLTSDLLMQAMCYDSIGVVCNALGQNERALEIAFKALALYEQIPTQASEWQKTVCYNNIGVAYKKLNLLDKAEENFRQGLAIEKLTPNERMKYNLMSNVGEVNILQGRFDEALNDIIPAIDGFKKLNHKIGEVHSIVFLAHCYLGKRDYATAMKHYLVAMKLFKDVEHKVMEIHAIRGIGNVYVKMEAYTEAIAQYQKALNLATAIADHKEVCETYLYLGRAYKAMGKAEDAAETLDLGIALAKEKKLSHDLELLEKERYVLAV